MGQISTIWLRFRICGREKEQAEEEENYYYENRSALETGAQADTGHQQRQATMC